MPLTTPDNIDSPNAGDTYGYVVDMGALADSVQTALNSRQNYDYRWAAAANRTAQTGMRINDLGYQIDTDTVYRYDGSAWRDWISSGTYTPTFTNVSLTGATVVGRYVKMGRTVSVFARITTGTATPVSGTVTVTVPYAMETTSLNATTSPIPGGMVVRDASPSATIPGFVVYGSSTTVILRVSDNTTTYGQFIALSSAIPITWATGDIIELSFVYRSAT